MKKEKAGRPIGSKAGLTKLDNQETDIREWVKKGLSYSAIGRLLDCHRVTVSNFCISKGISEKKIDTQTLSTVEEIPDVAENTDMTHALLMFENGISLHELADHFSMSYNSFTAMLRREGYYPAFQEIIKKRRFSGSSKSNFRQKLSN